MNNESEGSFSIFFWIALAIGLIGLVGTIAIGVGVMAGVGG